MIAVGWGLELGRRFNSKGAQGDLGGDQNAVELVCAGACITPIWSTVTPIHQTVLGNEAGRLSLCGYKERRRTGAVNAIHQGGDTGLPKISQEYASAP